MQNTTVHDSFEAKRQALANEVSKRVASKLEKQVPFSNEDVPRFLVELQKFESQGKSRDILVR
jgi:hypothetical protein